VNELVLKLTAASATPPIVNPIEPAVRALSRV
jgi:hypothetical protein